jgi:hypothetical protein
VAEITGLGSRAASSPPHRFPFCLRSQLARFK